MSTEPPASSPVSLSQLLDGWQGYQTSLLHALEPLRPEALEFRPGPGRRTLGEQFRHLALGRVTWLARLPAPGMEEVVAAVPEWFTDGDGSRHAVESAIDSADPVALLRWLRLSWMPIDRLLAGWTMADLACTYRHRFRGTDYRVSFQWTIYRVLAHDHHHGGMIALMLAMQGIEAFELRGLGGHLVEPPRW